MISTRCPSCGAPVHFRHASSGSAVCASCRSVVVRTDQGVRDAGKVSAFVRELSPLRIGARGRHDGRDFAIVGVVRKGRPGIRWNEWHVAFDDGGRAWLGEGNGEYAMYEEVRGRPVDLDALRPGGQVDLGGRPWWVMEVADAEVLAADGELPTGISMTPFRYADLRADGGRLAATLDATDDPPSLWLGPIVELAKLSLENTRPIAGWSDPDVRAAQEGDDVAGARSLACPECTASLPLSGDTRSVVCRYCGAVIALDDLTVTGHDTGARDFEKRLAIPLGARGTLEGVEWQVIGAMERFVENGWGRWPWTEYYLYNPWRGFRWLVHDGTAYHWTFVERLKDLPTVSSRVATHDRHRYRRFSAGTAEVDHVLGEFGWQVSTGERALVADYVDPPWVLSTEKTAGELAATLGKWIPSTAVERAFGVRVRPQRGVAPAQPNPFESQASIRLTAALALGGVLLGGALFAWLLLSDRPEPLSTAAFAVGADPVETFVTPPFSVPEGTTTLTVDIDGLSADQSIVYPALVNVGTGEAALLDIGGRTEGTGWLWHPTPGAWVLRLEVARASPLADGGRSVEATVSTGRTWKWPAVWLVGVGLASVGAWALGRHQLESKRWSDADE